MKHILKYILVVLMTLPILSCTEEDDGGCETETVCFGDGNCVERPIPGTCF